uniref:GOLD domain-containing protein n=1 Tax=Parastrongyloides trichosuri TaxID=131310 RepID=A0A0N4ZSN1_PARTI
MRLPAICLSLIFILLSIITGENITFPTHIIKITVGDTDKSASCNIEEFSNAYLLKIKYNGRTISARNFKSNGVTINGFTRIGNSISYQITNEKIFDIKCIYNLSQVIITIPKLIFRVDLYKIKKNNYDEIVLISKYNSISEELIHEMETRRLETETFIIQKMKNNFLYPLICLLIGLCFIIAALVCYTIYSGKMGSVLMKLVSKMKSKNH